jgi:alpha-beta hydrolase superfamily lysophospholipase
MFWGSVQNNFWTFAHNPSTYAQKVTCPVLLLYGAQDPKVSRQEINQIYQNLRGPKQLRVYPRAGHENYLVNYRPAWVHDVSAFLQKN